MKQLFCLLLILAASVHVFSQDAIPVQTIYSSNFTIDGRSRNCIFYIPFNYGKQEMYPLLIMLHDKGADAKALIKNFGDMLHANADSIPAVIIYPDAVAGKWNDDAADSINDVGYLSILVDYFVQRYQCNPHQVFVAGFGNGASMAYRFSCDLPGKVTAAALFSNAGTRPVCNNFSVPIMPEAGKINNLAINAMWKFFMQQAME